MANINKSNNNTTNKKGSNKTPVGNMPKDKIARFKLSGNISTSENGGKYTTYNTSRIAKSVRLISTYRMHAHKVAETKLPSSLKQSVHYFLTPMSRGDSDNTKDRKGIETVVEAQDNNNETTE